jgi:DNA-binding transcriptional ArsR family regulator
MPRTPFPDGPAIAAVAGLIGDPSRAAILTALLGGVARPAGELARRAGISPQTASVHLARLVEGGLIRVRTSGRQRYFSLAGAPVARVLESLALIAPPAAEPGPQAGFELRRLRRARTCYDHLAGGLGVAVTEALVERGRLDPNADGYEVTPAGETWLNALEVDVEGVRSGRRAFARACLDWSERRPHLAGALGAALTARFFEVGWIARLDGTRAVVATAVGRRALRRELGVTADAGQG